MFPVKRKSNRCLPLGTTHGTLDPNRRSGVPTVTDANLTDRQLAILNVIEEHMRRRGYPPSVREIGTSWRQQAPQPLRHETA